MRSLKILFLGLLVGLGCGDDDGGPGADAPSGGGEPPVISMVAWTQAAGCTQGTASDVTVVTTVTDADTAAASLTFSGTISGCSGMVDSAEATINCPQAFPYMGTVRVRDPEGNEDSQAITIDVCQDGSAP